MVLVRNLCVPPVHLARPVYRPSVCNVVCSVLCHVSQYDACTSKILVHRYTCFVLLRGCVPYVCAYIYLFMYKYCIACCLASRQRRGKLHYSLPLKEANFAENSAPAAGLAKIQGMPQKHMQPMIE